MALGSDKKVTDIVPSDVINRIRSDAAVLFEANGHPPPAIPQQNQSHLTSIQGSLLHSWSGWAGDPAHSTAAWLWTGAPAGISVDFELDGLLEAVGPEHPLGVDELPTDMESFRNYAGVESDPEAIKIIDNHVNSG